jgi:hypothetical protein
MTTVVTILWALGVICWALGALKVPSLAKFDLLQAGLGFFGAGLVVARL